NPGKYAKGFKLSAFGCFPGDLARPPKALKNIAFWARGPGGRKLGFRAGPNDERTPSMLKETLTATVAGLIDTAQQIREGIAEADGALSDLPSAEALVELTRLEAKLARLVDRLAVPAPPAARSPASDARRRGPSRAVRTRPVGPWDAGRGSGGVLVHDVNE